MDVVGDVFNFSIGEVVVVDGFDLGLVGDCFLVGLV